jgi:hypothetical protein
MKEEDKINIILKELEFLQGVIARQENARLTIRNWYMGFITVLVVAFFSKEISMNKNAFISIGSTLTLLFYWTELVYRVAEKRAMVRSNEVEGKLRESENYDGPKIGVSLGRPNTIKDQLKEVPNNVRISGPYLVMLIMLLLIYFFPNK